MPMDREYRKMMVWVTAALIASVVAAVIIVEIVIRYFAP
jgi:hypothetical protein